jgi:hypothetical protein
MFSIDFSLEGNTTIVQIDGNELMEKATEKFFIKTGEDDNSTYFLYNGNQITLSEKISKLANHFDRENKKMSILALKFEAAVFRKEIKNIICPKCKEVCFININDYKISLNNCK